MLLPQSEVRAVSSIDAVQRALIAAYLQGAVYSWVKSRPHEEFAARDLVGGINADWNGTPLQALYDFHAAKVASSTVAEEAAAKDLGWLLKDVLDRDARMFESRHDGWVNHYRLAQHVATTP